MNGMILTEAGLGLLAKALAGSRLEFTGVWCGDGLLDGRDPMKLQGLISPKRELPIQSMSVSNSIGTSEIVVEMSNKGLQTGFFVREYGLFAKDPDTQKEVLYSYCNKEGQAGYLEGDNGVDQINYALTLVTVIDQAPNVTAYISNTNQYVTASRMEQRFVDLFAPYGEPYAFWAQSPAYDLRMRPVTVDKTRELILQGVDVSGLNGRIEQLEDAIARTWLMLEAQTEFPGYSHFMAEDFKDTSMLDMFSAEVRSVVAGDDSLDVDPVEGLIPGSWYILADAAHSENVQVESISLENGIQRVILSEPVKNTYLIPGTVLYRSSTVINGEAAAGPRARISQEWLPDYEWQGTGSYDEFTVNLDISVKNSNARILSGYAAVSGDNTVTLG